MSHTLIIGSGVAAAAIATQLLVQDEKATIEVLEAGGQMPIADRRKWLDYVMTGHSPSRSFGDQAGDNEINKDGGFGIAGGRLMMRGGTTNHWGGWSPRLKPEDFHLGDVRSDAINWPFDYAHLAPYYLQAEHFLNVCGSQNNSAAPRFGEPFPHKPLDFSAMDQLLIPTFERLNIHYESMSIARDPKRCLTTGTCDYCPFDARYTADTSFAQLLNRYPNRLSLKLNAPVQQIALSDKNSVEGVRYLDQSTSKTEFAEADRVIVAAGTIESTKLLLASESQYWEKGIGNHSDHLGRHLVTHPMVRAVAKIPNNTQHIEQELAYPTLASREYDTEQQQPNGKFYFVRYATFSAAPLFPALASGKSSRELDKQIKQNTTIELRGFIEAVDVPENRLSLASGQTKFGLPRTKVQFSEAAITRQMRDEYSQKLQDLLAEANMKDPHDRSYWGTRMDHSTGTCRMSDSPSDGVVDGNLKVHDMDNLYVCSNATFPNGGAVNPTLTLTALAFRLANHLAS